MVYFSRINIFIKMFLFLFNLAYKARIFKLRSRNLLRLFAPDHSERKVLKTLTGRMVYGIRVSTGRYLDGTAVRPGGSCPGRQFTISRQLRKVFTCICQIIRSVGGVKTRMIYDRVLRLRLISFGRKEKWQEFKVARMGMLVACLQHSKMTILVVSFSCFSRSLLSSH